MIQPHHLHTHGPEPLYTPVKADEIARGFKAEGWKEVPEKERENATYGLGGWIDERDMPAMEPRVGTRYFLIDVLHLTWRFFFRKGVA